MADKQIIKNGKAKAADMLKLYQSKWPEVSKETKIVPVTTPLLIIPHTGHIEVTEEISLIGCRGDLFFAGYNPELDTIAVILPLVTVSGFDQATDSAWSETRTLEVVK